MLALWARYQVRAVGRSTKASQSSTLGADAGPPLPPTRATASHPSRSSRSFSARHHLLPGGSASSGLSSPRLASQRMNEIAARRNGRWRGASPVGPP